MRIDNARVILEWSNGKTVELGTLEITASSEAETRISARMRCFRQRTGWELVRKGFWLMLPWRKWKETQL